DGAHNLQAADVLASYLTAQRAGGFPHQGRLIFVVGMMRDKDQRGILTRLARIPGTHDLILTRAKHPRAAEPEELAQTLAGREMPIDIASSLPAAFARARAL